VLVRIIIVVLVAFPYLLYRVATTFREPPRFVRRGIDRLTIGAIVAFFPGPTEPRPKWIVLYTALLVVQWTVTSVYAAYSLWVAGNGRPEAARYRMRLLAGATAALNVSILISSVAPQSSPNHPNTFLQLFQLAVALTFFFGIAPPRALID